MAYLTYAEYKTFTADPVLEPEFDKLILRAEAAINTLIRYFYDGMTFENDFDWRKKAVKSAVAFQVDYYHESGASSQKGLTDTPQQVTLGRTSITREFRSGHQARGEAPFICQESINALTNTGLLYRGVEHGF